MWFEESLAKVITTGCVYVGSLDHRNIVDINS